jgi:hypothetical protein
MQKEIIVHNLNKLRWLYPNQVFITNVLKPQTTSAFQNIINILTLNNIPFSIKQ